MAGIIQVGRVQYGAIHFATRFPVVETPCGRLGPSAARWGYVTCLACLRRAPKDPRIAVRLAALLEEERRRVEGEDLAESA
jgi:hypothetical protein